MARIPRSRGAVSGVLLVPLGARGALGPFAGPYFHHAYTPDTAGHFTLARLWLEILPGAAAVLGGVLVAVSARRLLACRGAFLAGLGGAWLAVGTVIGPACSGAGLAPGTPGGGTSIRAFEQIAMFTGLGIVIVLVAAMTLGRCLVAADSGSLPAGDAPDGPDYFTPGDDATAGTYSTGTAPPPSGR